MLWMVPRIHIYHHASFHRPRDADKSHLELLAQSPSRGPPSSLINMHLIPYHEFSHLRSSVHLCGPFLLLGF